MSDDEQMGLSPPSSPRSYKADDYDLPSGVKKTIVTEGSGWEKPKERYEVKVKIQGKHGETVFDSSEGEPRVYTVGSGLPCKGVDSSFKHMKKGEKAKLTIEARMAFGAEGLPDKNVPADAEVEYEVELVDWVKVEDLSKAKDGSILVKVLEEGPEWDKPKDSDVVFLRYRGRLTAEDTYFETHGTAEGAPARRLRVAELEPAGLRAAVKDLKRGSRASVALAPAAAFGDAGRPDLSVPGGAAVEYEVELVDLHAVTDAAKDGGVLVEMLSKTGGEWKKPKETSRCVVNLEAAAAGEGPWDSRVFSKEEGKVLVIGTAPGDEAPPTDGLERALEQLVKGQSALVTVRADYAYGDAGLPGKVGPGQAVEYKVELVSFEEAKSSYSMSANEKKEHSERVKGHGNAYFKAGDVRRALRRYEAAHEPFEYLDSIKEEDEKKAAQEIKAACLLNMAACYEKLQDWSQVVSKCNKALELPVPASHSKAYFRRAKAYTQMGRLQEAKADLDRLLQHDANDKTVLSMLGTVRKLQKDQDARAKQVFGKMFA